MNDVASSRDLEGQDGQPGDGIFPGTGKAEGRVDEAADVHGEGAVDGVHDCELGKGLHHEIDHDSDGQETNDDSRWTSVDERTAGADEQPRANGAAAVLQSVLCTAFITELEERRYTHGNHLHVSALEVAVQVAGFAHDDVVGTIIGVVR